MIPANPHGTRNASFSNDIQGCEKPVAKSTKRGYNRECREVPEVQKRHFSRGKLSGIVLVLRLPGSGEHARKPAPLGETGKMRGGTKHSVSCRLQGDQWDSPFGAAPLVPSCAGDTRQGLALAARGRGSPPGFHAHDTGTRANASPHAVCRIQLGTRKKKPAVKAGFFRVTSGIRTHDNRNHNPGLYR